MRVQARWYSFHFLVQQLVGSLVRLRILLNVALPLLPGADIPHAHPASKGELHSLREALGTKGESRAAKELDGKVAQVVQIAVE
jgi:hypothetical protein